jgi:hypothetical protein
VVPRAELGRLGPLDEGYFLYYEETEWLWRARRRGVGTAVAADARVVHRWGHATVRRDDARDVERASRERFFERNYPSRWRRLLERVGSGSRDRAVPASQVRGPDGIPPTPADLWLVSNDRRLEPAAASLGGVRLPASVDELAARGEWYALAARRSALGWRVQGLWRWSRQ